MSTVSTSNSDAWGKTTNGKPVVGATCECSLIITAEVTRKFAEISGDDNPLHFDEAAAKRSIFGELIGHGAMMIGVVNGAMVKELPGPGAVMMHSDLKFSNPMRVGEKITGRVEVLEVRDDKPICKVRVTVTRSDGKVCMGGTILTYVSPM
ncbi:MaoC family dehydratase [Caballeronia cordobensis]|uniref:MaoC family dehydratase n=1 Tax=Caballeronia cordobensis TaxID=1353886 RepID=UPI00045EE9E1|nr:putative membrane protein [Burkholderia sp. RPE67]